MTDGVPNWLIVTGCVAGVVLGWVLIGWLLGEFRCDKRW